MLNSDSDCKDVEIFKDLMEKILIFIKLNIYKIPVFKNLMDSDMLFKKKHFVRCYGLNCVSYRILKS